MPERSGDGAFPAADPAQEPDHERARSRGRSRWGFEIKHTVAPEVTKSMRIAMADLGLHRLDVIHTGADTYPLARDIRAVAVDRLQTDLSPLG